MFSLGLISLQHSGILSILTNAPFIMRLSTLSAESRNYFWSWMGYGDCFLWFFYVAFPLGLGDFFQHMHWSLLSWRVSSVLESSLSPCISPFSIALPCEFYLPLFPYATISISSTQGKHWFLYGLPLPQHGPETSSRQLARATTGLTLFALHLTGVTVPHIQCLENHCFIYSAQFVGCFGRENNLPLHIGQMWNSWMTLD